jgi:hypothetical protein
MFWHGVGVLLAAVVMFVATEHYIWHHPRYEFVFWLVAATIFTCLLTLSPDSPLHYIISLELGPLSLTIFLGLVVPLGVSFILESSRVANLSIFEASNQPKTNKVNHSGKFFVGLLALNALDTPVDEMNENSSKRLFVFL